MKVGRNDNCPCGSGKKFKHCCLAKGQGASSGEPAPLVQPAQPSPKARTPPSLQPIQPFPAYQPEPFSPPPPDPEREFFDAFWNKFAALDLDGKIAMFLETLDNPEIMDDQVAYDMLSEIGQDCKKNNQRDRYDDLVAALRAKSDQLYQPNAIYFVQDLLDNALVANRRDRLPELARELAALASKDLDIFNRSRAQLEYYGELDLLLEMYRNAWPEVKDSEDILAWGVDEFANKAVDYEIFVYLEQTEKPDPQDPELRQRCLVFLGEFNEEFWAAHVLALAGQGNKQWTLEDFLKPFSGKKREKKKEGVANLQLLLDEFLGWVHRQEGIAWTKGNLGKSALLDYFLERNEGKLAQRGKRAYLWQDRGDPSPPPPKIRHPLLPDAVSLDIFLGSYFDFLGYRPYDAVALAELIPSWFRFLKMKALVTEEEAQTTLKSLNNLYKNLLKFLEEQPEYSALAKALASLEKLPEIPKEIVES